MTPFEKYKQEILVQLVACGGNTESTITKYPKQSSWIIAAATIVAAEEGIGWCQEDLQRFIDQTLNRLGFWVSLVLFFIAGSGIIWLLARLIIPIIVDWLVERQKLGVYGSAPGDSQLVGLAHEAKSFLEKEGKKGKKHE